MSSKWAEESFMMHVCQAGLANATLLRNLNVSPVEFWNETPAAGDLMIAQLLYGKTKINIFEVIFHHP